MFDITVIILTKDEELHIRRCLERLRPLEAERIVIIDSESTDGTCRIAREMGAEVVVHPWPGNQAAQFNWALDNLDIQSPWVLRLDADEYLSPELIEEIKRECPALPEDVSAVVLPLGRVFLNRELKHGIVNGVSMIRLFRTGKCRYEQRLMDEHLTVLSGSTVTFRNKFYDASLLPVSDFIAKHNSYSNRQAAVELIETYHLQDNDSSTFGDSNSDTPALASTVAHKRSQKSRYSRMPLFVRSFGYFLYRYIFKLGFLDGKEGFLWDFFQGWWYRTLVDAKILEIKRKSNGDPEAIKRILKEQYNIAL